MKSWLDSEPAQNIFGPFYRPGVCDLLLCERGKSELTMTIADEFRRTVESAGGHFVELKEGIVFFSSAPGDKVLSLFAFACTKENVSLSLKAFR